MYAALGAFAVVVDRRAELGGDHRLVASGAEGTAEELLALGTAVDVGGVEEVDPGVERGADHGAGRGVVDPHAEVVAADADRRDLECTDAA